MNFWRPGVKHTNAPEGSYWLFLRKPDTIVGCARVEISTSLPLWLAWETFTNSNGADTREQFYDMVARRRAAETTPLTEIGCIGLVDPTFFDTPIDFRPFKGQWQYRNPVKSFSFASAPGLWDQVRLRLLVPPVASQARTVSAGTKVQLVAVRLGQGGFRNKVIDVYERRCAVTGERSLPALEAAHIKPYKYVQKHEVRNGLLLRADIHKLFDVGYVSISPDHRFKVSPALRTDYENGRAYYELENVRIRDPIEARDGPAPEFLEWHYSSMFKR